MRQLFVGLLLTASLCAQTIPETFVYSAYRDESVTLKNLVDDYRHPLTQLHFNEVNPFDFDATFGSLPWDCSSLGKQITGMNQIPILKGHHNLSDKDIAVLLKDSIVLDNSCRNKIWKGPTSNPRVFCTFRIDSPEQKQSVTEFFAPYAKKKLILPWYEGILTEGLGKFAPYWSVGKTAFNLLYENKESDIETAQSMMTLAEQGGRFERVVLYDETWSAFEVAIQYSVQVGTAPQEHHVVLYSIVYNLTDTKPGNDPDNPNNFTMCP